MKHLILASLFFSLSLANAAPIGLSPSAPAGAKACLGTAGAVQEGYRPLISGKTYGACIATLCGAAYDLNQGQCSPVQKASITNAKSLVMKSGDVLNLNLKTSKVVSSGTLQLSSDSQALSLENNGVVTFSNQNQQSLQITAQSVDTETIVHLNLQKVSGKIDVASNQTITIKVQPIGKPKILSLTLDKANPTSSDPSVNITLTLSKALSQTASTKLTFDVSGQKSLVSAGSLGNLSITIPKGQTSGVLTVPLSGEASSNTARVGLSSLSLNALEANGQTTYKEFSVTQSVANPIVTGIEISDDGKSITVSGSNLDQVSTAKLLNDKKTTVLDTLSIFSKSASSLVLKPSKNLILSEGDVVLRLN